ncbi:MAG: TIGR03936 family radical SAM-associated protein [Lachnospiraceae bacterium]|nr:TIGR03936 family radical SAM-associated protein [Lachnospiraceae bacterium]
MAYKLRIKFNKYAHMIFIGHLDLMRYFQKAMRRGGVDISYSEGFSPHQIMSFAQPLGVGIYSDGEYMDISVNSLTSEQQLKDALNGVMSEGVDILSVKLLADKTPNSMASVVAASYFVAFREGYEPDFDLAKAAADFYAQDKIMIEKETKKGTRTLDLKEHIYSFSYDPDKNSLYMLLDASSGGNIKPSLVMEQLYREQGRELGEFDLIVTREDMFALKDPDKPGVFISLGEIGDSY